MGKQSVTDAETRLRELIREANGAAKDLGKGVDTAKAIVTGYIDAKVIEPEVRALLEEMTAHLTKEAGSAVDQLEVELGKIFESATSTVFEIFDTLLRVILSRDVVETMRDLLAQEKAGENLVREDREFIGELLKWAAGKQVNTAQRWEAWRETVGKGNRFDLRGRFETRVDHATGVMHLPLLTERETGEGAT